MNRAAIAVLALGSTLGLGATALAQQTDAARTYTEALGISLEGWPYPHPLHFLSLAMEGQPVRMAYMDVPPSAPPNGRTALLLHGKNFDSSYWAATIFWLAASGWRVVVPDQVGFNKSSKPHIDYHFDALAANTAELLDHLGVGQVDLIGHSTGGMLAVRFTLTFPDRVARLVLEDPIGLEDYRAGIPPQTTETLVEAERRTTTDSYRAFIKRYFPLLPAEDQEPFVAWRMRVALSGEFERFAYATASTYQMIYREPVRSEYHLLRPPVLIVVGGADRSVVLKQYGDPKVTAGMGDFPSLARAACAEVPRCELVVVPQVGHVPHLERPEAFQEHVAGFLQQ